MQMPDALKDLFARSDWWPFALVVVLLLLVLGLAIWAMARARHAAKRSETRDGPAPAGLPGDGVVQRLADALRALRYLNTGSEWRYKVPWILMLGERGAGKSSLVASLTTGQRQTLLLRERRLAFSGTGWAFFDGGVVIDVDGRLPNADAQEGAGRRWSAVLARIDRYRPERPVDGVVLAVSARSLLAEDPAQARAAAEQCYRQLWTLQKRFEFALPVYLVVTQCDSVPGYRAFWRLQSEQRRRQMVGWANPYGVAHDFQADWADQAFDQTKRAMRTLMLQAAARPEGIDDFDEFFLFPRRFEALRVPLRNLLGYVFRPGAYHEDFALRGIWFTGSLADPQEVGSAVNDQVDFADGLFDAKVFPERNLAHPTRQGVLSRNRLIRRLQLGVGALFVALLLTLAGTAMRLDGQVDAAVSALALLQQPEGTDDGGCVSSEVVYDLLDKISRIDVDLVYPAIPASWFDHRITDRTATYVSDAAFEEVVFPSLACHLARRGKALLQGPGISAYDGHTPPAKAVEAARRSLLDYVTGVRDFELNMARFQRISLPAGRSAGHELLGVFAQVADYAYGRPLPARLRHGEGKHVSALAKVSNQVFPDLPADYRSLLAGQLVTAMSQAKSRLDGALGRGATLLEQLDTSDSAVDGPLLASWLGWIQHDWLGQGVDGTTVCAAFADGLAPVLGILRRDYAYPPSVDQAAQSFAPAQCRTPAMQRIAALRVSPYGALFVPSGDGYQMIPALTQELGALAELANLAYMQVPVTQSFRCQPAPAGWHAQSVAEAAGAIHQYQAFSLAQARVQGLPQGATPLYEQVARRALLGVLDQAMARSQRAQSLADTSQPTWVTPLSEADEELAARSQSFSRALDPLLFVLRGYAELGFNTRQAHVVSCLREFATGTLARIDDLADASALYAPAANPSYAVAQGVKPYFNLGGNAQASDYLKRQLQRAQVLASYAGPFVQLLRNTDAVNGAATDNDQSGDYWQKSINEINGYIQFKKPVGEVVNIQQLVEQVLVPLAPENCGVLLADYKAPPVYNDLFSHKRAALERRADWYCHDHAKAVLWDQYDGFAVRFNQSLAGRYPFGANSDADASLATVRSFLRDYQQQRPSLDKGLAQLPADQGKSVRLFIDELDQLADFYDTSLAATSAAQPLSVQVGFRYRPDKSAGGGSIVRWRLAVGDQLARYPNGPDSVSWSPGQTVTLELDWADLGGLKPTTDPKRPDLSATGFTARFSATGPWALMHFIDRHRSTDPNLADPADPARLVLEFQVPVVKDGETKPSGITRVFLTLDLSSKDPKTGKTAGLVYPAVRPTSAPTIWGDSSHE